MTDSESLKICKNLAEWGKNEQFAEFTSKRRLL